MKWHRELRIYIMVAIAIILIVFAVLFSVVRATLPFATSYKNEIEQKVSQKIGLPVVIKNIDAQLHWFSPRIKLEGVSVFDENKKVPILNFKEAFAELNVWQSIIRREIIVANIGLIGIDLSIEKLSQKEWLIQGQKFNSEESEQLPEDLIYMLLHSDYLLDDSNIYYKDHTADNLSISLLDISVSVENQSNQHKIKLTVKLPEDYGENFSLVANLKGEPSTLDGTVFIEASQLKLEKINEKFEWVKFLDIKSTTDVDLWLELSKNEIKSLTTKIIANNIVLKNKINKESWHSNYLKGEFQFLKTNDAWRGAIKDFYFGDKGKPKWSRTINVIASEDENFYSLSHDFLRYSDITSILKVVLPKSINKKIVALNKFKIKADFYNTTIKLPKPKKSSVKNVWDMNEILEQLQFKTSVNDLSVHNINSNIDVFGIDASINYQNKQAQLVINSTDAKINFSQLFRKPIFARTLNGLMQLNKNQDGWVVQSDTIKINNAHLKTDTRLKVNISTENKILVDIKTNFSNGNAQYVSNYLPVGIMEKSLVNWLDAAIIDGYVSKGNLVLQGDIDDFPFRNKKGKFQILFDVKKAKLKFLENWPQLNNISASLKFDKLSLDVNKVSTNTSGIFITSGFAKIKDMSQPHLSIKLKAKNKLPLYKKYILLSPLNDILGDIFNMFKFKGGADLALNIEVPIEDDEVIPTFDGTVNFNNAQLYYPTLNYQIKQVKGVLNFTENVVLAHDISATMQNKNIHIDVETIKTKKENESEIAVHLNGLMDINYLFQTFDWVPKNWLSGQSKWHIGIFLPKKNNNYLTKIIAQSDLENIKISVSDKVLKQQQKALDFSSIITVLKNDSLIISAKLLDGKKNKLMTGSAWRNENLWNFNVTSNYLKGAGSFVEGLGKETRSTFNLDEINVSSLFLNSADSQGKIFSAADFPLINLNAKVLIWKNWTFKNVQLQTQWKDDYLAITKLRLNGNDMVLDAKGSWKTQSSGENLTLLKGSVVSENFGNTLTGLGYADVISRGKYNAKFDLRWAAPPYSFDFSILKGTTNFKMKEGDVLEADPGTGGRLLGLLNIFSIANRLALDFDDVYRKGFSFDKLKGRFEFSKGVGSLKDFNVVAPAADVNIFGRVGLVEQDYNLLMRVTPHTDSLTLAGGVLLGGPLVGAGLAVIQKAFNVGFVDDILYSITGAWDKPKIEKIIEKVENFTNQVEDDDLE